MKTLSQISGLLIVLAALLAFVYWQDGDRRDACEAAGGEYHNVDRGSICIKPGSEIKLK